MTKFFKAVVVLVIFVLGAYLFLTFQWGPYGKGGTVYIPRGYSVRSMGQRLAQAGILRNEWSFSLLVRLKKVGHALQAGEYEFAPGIDTAQVIEKLRKGERVVRRLTIPEGYTFEQIAQLMVDAGIGSLAEIKATFQDPRYLQRLGFPAVSLEGYLFPETYEYDRSTTVEDLLGRMIDEFKKNLGPLGWEQAQGVGWTIPQWVTFASIIEKETGQAVERPKIASVFHNRLRLGMPLQSDPTVIYGLPNFDGNLRKNDLLNPHLYNTYVYKGLPPGPIASPGKESLRAVLYPENSEFLFFVSRGDGSHYFSRSLEEHNAAVQRFQLDKTEATLELIQGATPAPSTPQSR